MLSDKKKLVDDLMTLGNAVIGNALGARHEFRAQAKQRLGSLAQQFDLVTREEFDAAFAMLSKARLMQEEIVMRLAKIEAHLNLSSAKTQLKAKKVNLPSVKRSARKQKRK